MKDSGNAVKANKTTDYDGIVKQMMNNMQDKKSMESEEQCSMDNRLKMTGL